MRFKFPFAQAKRGLGVKKLERNYIEVDTYIIVDFMIH